MRNSIYSLKSPQFAIFIWLVLGSLFCVNAQAYFTNTSNSAVDIPDNNGVWASSTVNVTGIPENYNIFYMDFGVHINHTWSGDLEMVLTNPNNSYVLGLVDRAGNPNTTFGYSANLGEPILFTDYSETLSELMGEGLSTNDIITGEFMPSWDPGLSLESDYGNFWDLAQNYPGSKNGDWIFWARDNASGDTGSIQSISINIGYDRYCVPFTDNFFEYITNVSFGSLNYNSGAFDKAHPDYRTVDMGEASIPVQRGQTYPISVTIDADTNEYIYLFVDWNQDGDFADANETYTIAANVVSDGPHSIDVTIPDTALLGETRMRVYLDYNQITPDPCLTGFGDVKDFTLLVQNSMGVEDVNALNTMFYPNPVTDVAHFTSRARIQEVRIFNLEGKEVFTKNVNSLNVDLNLASLPAGNYVVKVKTDNGVDTMKMIKK